MSLEIETFFYRMATKMVTVSKPDYVVQSHIGQAMLC